MKKELLAISTALFLLGCGEQIKKDDNNAINNDIIFDFWDYRVSNENITKGYKYKLFNTGGYLINESNVVVELIEENHINSETVIINDTITIRKYSDYIDFNGTNEERFVKIGDQTKENCTVHKYYDTYNPYSNITFDDVLQVSCFEDENTTLYINYSKQYGNIGHLLKNDNYTELKYYEINTDLNGGF